MPFPLLVLAWCFAVGACVGSFLNVVAWRMPQGMSLSWPGSHCPRCKKPIAIRDNVPILGWLILGGKCRSCRNGIAGRYPTVELLTALAFAALAWVELMSDGANLPIDASQVAAEEFVIPLATLLRVWVYHAVLAALLIVASLFEIDGAPVPRRFAVTGLLLGLLPAWFWPELHPWNELGGDTVSPQDPVEWGAWLAVGAFLGAALGWFTAWGADGRTWGTWVTKTPAVAALALVGAFLGAHAALTTAAIVAAATFVQCIVWPNTGKRYACPATTTAVVALLYVIFWRQIVGLPWPGRLESKHALALTAAAPVLLGVASLVVTRVKMKRREPRPKTSTPRR